MFYKQTNRMAYYKQTKGRASFYNRPNLMTFYRKPKSRASLTSTIN